MADKPFNRVIVNRLERPLSTDINQLESEYDRTIRYALERIYAGRASDYSPISGAPISGFIGDAFRVEPVSPVAMQVKVLPGIGFAYNAIDTPAAIDGVQGLDDLGYWKPLMLSVEQTLNVPAAPSSPNSRYDIVEVRYNRVRADSASRDVFDPIAGKFNPTSVLKTLSWDLDGDVGYVTDPASSTASISLKSGIPGVSPSVPATTTGYVKIAEILVGSSVTTLDLDVINHKQALLFPANSCQVACKIQTASSGPLVCTLSDVIAPPGVRVIAVADFLTTADCWIYIIAGSYATTTLPIISVSRLDIAGGGIASVKYAQQFTITPTEQTLLAGSQASPATKVAVGQKVYRALLTQAAPASPAYYLVQVAIKGV